jgi:hypothetical protein
LIATSVQKHVSAVFSVGQGVHGQVGDNPADGLHVAIDLRQRLWHVKLEHHLSRRCTQLQQRLHLTDDRFQATWAPHHAEQSALQAPDVEHVVDP